MATILHVDADGDTQQLVQSALGDRYDVVSVADGPTAIQYCAMIQPDLILVDLALPGIDGRELVSRLKLFMPQTPVLIVSDQVAGEAEVNASIIGVDGLLTKPIDVERLAQYVKLLLPQPVKLPEFTTNPPEEEVVKQFELQIAALNKANRRLASLNAISALIGTSLDLEHLTDEILAQIHKILNFDSATLLLLKGDVLEAAASRGLSGYRQGMNVYAKSDRNSAWRVVTNKLPLIVKDVTRSDYWESRPELSRIRSWLGVPLICKDRVVGVLTLDKNEPDAFIDADARYLFTLAYQIAIAVENAQLFEEWEEQATRLKLINEVAQEISTILSVNELLEALARAIFERLHYDRVAILEVDESRTFLTLKALYGTHSPKLEIGVHRQPLDSGLIGKVLRIGSAVLASDASDDDNELLLEGLGVHSELIVPIFVDGQTEAVISVGKVHPDGFNDQELWTLSSLASQAATSIENARLYNSLAQRLSDLAMLNEAGQALTSTIALDEMLSIVVERASLALSAESGYVLLIDNGDEVFTVTAATGSEMETLAGAKLDARSQLIKRVIREGEPALLKRLDSNADIFADLDWAFHKPISTIVVAPLQTRRIIIGLVVLINKQVGDFDANDLNLLGALSQLMVGAVENAQLFKQIHSYSDRLERIVMARTQRLQAIRKISQVVSQGLAVDDLLAVAGRDISQIFTPDSSQDTVKVIVGLIDGSKLTLKTIYGSIESHNMLPGGKNEGQQAPQETLSGTDSSLEAVQSSGVLKLKIDLKRPFGQVISQSKPLILRELKPQDLYSLAPPKGNDQVIPSVMIAPLVTGGKTIGLIMIESRMAVAFDESDLETLETLAFQVATAIEHARLLQKTREIAIVEERTRLARDMHDGVAQNLAYLLIQVDRCLNMVEEESKLERNLEQIGSLLKQNIDELRRNIFDLRPVDLEGKSLFGVLKNFVTEFGRRWNLRTSCTIYGEVKDISAEVESSLYRILQETLSNARQHAQCTELSVILAVRDNQWLSLEVRDNGRGFDVSQVGQRSSDKSKRGLGLISMRERVDSIGGELVIKSEEAQGTHISARLPLSPVVSNAPAE